MLTFVAPKAAEATPGGRGCASDCGQMQDSGVAADADIVVATASLEVGFDDDRVGAVLQHKAPHDVAQFLQRKGRAGRNSATRASSRKPVTLPNYKLAARA